MLTQEMNEILTGSKETGWVLEPMAKRLFSLVGLDVPRFTWAKTVEEAIRSANEISYPVVCKVVSSKVIHKSDRNGVTVGVASDQKVKETFTRYSRIEGFLGMLVEPVLSGIELIVGAKVDYQFGPVILLGIGGTGVEIYRDVALRMAPLVEKDVVSMIKHLTAHQMLEGYRGSDPVDLKALSRLLVDFSGVAMDLSEMVESIDLNPVMSSSTRCAIADARIILKTEASR
jgi:succinyl-CoA synthetase beta subunit